MTQGSYVENWNFETENWNSTERSTLDELKFLDCITQGDGPPYTTEILNYEI